MPDVDINVLFNNTLNLNDRVTILEAKNTYVVKSTGTQTVNNSTSLVNVEDLAWNIGASEDWIFEYVIFGNCPTSTAAWKFSITFPAGVTAVRWGAIGIVGYGGQASSTGSTSGTAVVGGLGEQEEIFIRGIVRNGTTAGAVQLRYAQFAATAENLNLFRNSFLVAEKVS